MKEKQVAAASKRPLAGLLVCTSLTSRPESGANPDQNRSILDLSGWSPTVSIRCQQETGRAKDEEKPDGSFQHRPVFPNTGFTITRVNNTTRVNTTTWVNTVTLLTFQTHLVVLSAYSNFVDLEESP